MNHFFNKNCISGIVFLMLLTSCQSQTTRPEKAEKMAPLELTQDIDPYYVMPRDTVSSHGPQSIVRNIMQDKNGHFWLASWEGIVEYDGQKFINHTLKAGLRKYHTFSVLEDNGGNLWFGAIGSGAYRYDGKNFVNFTTADGLAGENVETMLADPSGNVWLGTNNGLSRYDGKTMTTFNDQPEIANTSIHSLYQDGDGKIWIGAGEGVICYDGSRFKPFLNPEGKPFKNVRCIIGDQKGNIWMGGSDGLYCFDGTSNKKITSDFTGRMYEDKNGKIWAAASGTDGMVVYQYDGKKLVRLLPEDAEETYYGKSFKDMKAESSGWGAMIFCFLEDKDANMWFCMHGGVTRYDGKKFYKM